MGIGLYPQQSLFDDSDLPKKYLALRKKRRSKNLPNPNPSNYEVLESQEVGRYLVLKVKYPDCINYEGVKIMVYSGVELEDLEVRGVIDPHFSENKKQLSPIARFE